MTRGRKRKRGKEAKHSGLSSQGSTRNSKQSKRPKFEESIDYCEENSDYFDENQNIIDEIHTKLEAARKRVLKEMNEDIKYEKRPHSGRPIKNKKSNIKKFLKEIAITLTKITLKNKKFSSIFSCIVKIIKKYGKLKKVRNKSDISLKELVLEYSKIFDKYFIRKFRNSNLTEEDLAKILKGYIYFNEKSKMEILSPLQIEEFNIKYESNRSNESNINQGNAQILYQKSMCFKLVVDEFENLMVSFKFLLKIKMFVNTVKINKKLKS